MNRSEKILLVIDASNFEYMCIFAASSRWEKNNPEEASLVLNDVWHTDQENLPELLNYNSFRRILSSVVQEKLENVVGIVKSHHSSEVEMAMGMDVIFTADSDLRENFRKMIYPEYKSQRDKERKRFHIKSLKSYIQDVIFKELNVENVMGYKLVKVDGCESDDIIATIMSNYTDYMLRVLISSDRDFLQIEGINQYDMWGNKVDSVIKNVIDEPISRKDYLRWKILRGDVSDNIKNVFPKYGDKKCYNLLSNKKELKRMLTENNSAMERFKLNTVLIDFRCIPDDYRKRIIESVDEKLNNGVEAIGFSELDGCMVI